MRRQAGNRCRLEGGLVAAAGERAIAAITDAAPARA